MPSSPNDLTPKARRTRSSLLTAAQALIGTEGISGLTVMSVCSEARVGRTSFYNYFDDIESLARVVATEAANRIKERFDDLHAGLPRGLERLEACLGMILRLSVEDPRTMLLLTSLARAVPEVPELVEKEIVHELSHVAGISGADRAPLGRFLTIATLALARQLAKGALPGDSVEMQLRFLMNACGERGPA